MNIVLNVLSVLALLAILLCAVFLFAPRLDGRRITLAQRFIRFLYAVANWMADFAIAFDRGYLAYRQERALYKPEPENEAFDVRPRAESEAAA